MLDKDEVKVIDHLALAYNQFALLKRHHPQEIDEFIFHIHALQMIVMSRSTQREMPEVFFQYE